MKEAKQEEAAAAQSQAAEEAAASDIAKVENATKVADIAVDDDFDINDI